MKVLKENQVDTNGINYVNTSDFSSLLKNKKALAKERKTKGGVSLAESVRSAVVNQDYEKLSALTKKVGLFI